MPDTKAEPLADALDAAGLTWTTGGAALWTAQTGVTHDGVDAAQSGSGNSPQSALESWLETSITGPGQLSFWWKFSSEDYSDFLHYTISGTPQSEYISGEVGWQRKTVNIPAGTRTLRWVHKQLRNRHRPKPVLAGRRAACSAGRDDNYRKQSPYHQRQHYTTH